MLIHLVERGTCERCDVELERRTEWTLSDQSTLTLNRDAPFYCAACIRELIDGADATPESRETGREAARSAILPGPT